MSRHTMTCSFLGGADQESESRTAGFECWTSCAAESVRLPVASDGDEKTRDDGDENAGRRRRNAG